jgi:hypothetical protein
VRDRSEKPTARNERGLVANRRPICISAKTSLRERYKQADFEAIALKYVHRKALSFLVTLEENEAKSVKAKKLSAL